MKSYTGFEDFQTPYRGREGVDYVKVVKRPWWTRLRFVPKLYREYRRVHKIARIAAFRLALVVLR